MNISLPWVAIIAAAGAYFVLGALWYGYFGEAWLKGLGKRKEDLNPKDPTPYITAAIGCLCNAVATAIVIGWATPLSDSKLMTALMVGILLGGAVIAASAAKHYSFSGWSWNLYLIDVGHDIVGFLLMSVIIVLMR